MSALTVEQFKDALPDKVKKSINQELIDRINQTLSDPEMFEAYRDNLLSYTRVMADGRFKVSEYVNAVKYVSHKLMGCTNIQAYSKTFPEKIDRFTNEGVSAKDIASYVTAYNKSKLVNLIFEQTLIPSYVLNQDLYQKALNTQAELMVTAKSEKVRSDAANSLLTHLKMPETQKVELSMSVKEDSSISQLRATTMELARQQKLMVQSGAMNAQQVAHSRLVGEVVDVQATEVTP
jgi:glucan phosphorylase